MKTYRALFLFAGLGGGALGFLRARHPDAKFTVSGAVDFDPTAALDFQRLTGHPCHVGDLSTMEPADLAAVCEGPPDVLFTSPPCKSFSGCLPAATAKTPKYRDMSDLAVRGLFLTLEAWPGHVPRLILLENVPRIQNRGRHLLDIITGMLRSYGYTCRETVHDCGDLGGLAQRRRRFLLVARHTKSTGDWWREPPRQRVRGVGEVLGQLPIPLPGSTAGGPMHALPRLSALNWLRLALIPAGGDWRDLPASVRLDERFHGEHGVDGWESPAGTVLGAATTSKGSNVADPRLDCEPRNGTMGVVGHDAPAGVVLANLDIHAGCAAVADPRPGYESRGGGHGVQAWGEPGRTVIGSGPIESKGAAVADPRLSEAEGRHRNKYVVVDGGQAAGTVIAADRVGSGAPSVADPRLSDRADRRNGERGVTAWTNTGGTVIGHADANTTAHVADPRVQCERNEGGHGVRRWDQPSACLIGHPCIDNWPGQVADPRALGYELGRIVETADGPTLTGVTLDPADKRPMDRPPIILALDGTWHRPMTDLELAALQSLPTQLDGEWLVLTGSRAKRRETIGNAVPVATAEAIATTALRCLVASDAATVTLSCDPVWVGPEHREEHGGEDRKRWGNR